jgi:hypothetical protein
LRLVPSVLVSLSISLVALSASARPRTVKADGSPGNMCGTVIPATPCPLRPATPGRRLVYLNKDGGQYNHGTSTSSVTNTFEMDGTGGTIAPLDTTKYDWPMIVQCVRDYYTDFNVEFTEEEPASGAYIEAVVGGNNDAIGFEIGMGDLLGVASTGDVCSVEEQGIAFAFAEKHDTFGTFRNAELCITIAHEVGHTLGLEHEVEPTDLMSYEENNHTGKGFQDLESQCGTYVGQEINCHCTIGPGHQNNRENTYDTLMDNVGPNESEPPVVMITDPAAGASVGPSFTVTATATDDTGVSTVELLVDGVSVQADTTAPYTLAVERVAIGPHTLDVRATDLSGNVGQATIDVNVTAECEGTGQSTCEDGAECVDGVCLLSFGSACETAADCVTGVCVSVSDTGLEKICTDSCEPGNDTCPAGFSCPSDSIGQAQCAPAEGGGGGCCSVVGPRRDPIAGGAGLVGLLGCIGLGGLLLRRRRRS